MKIELLIAIDSAIYEDFTSAVKSSGANQTKVIEGLMDHYTKSVMKKSTPTNSIGRKNNTFPENDFYGKANNRIPNWAYKTHQYNHKIIRSYFTAIDIAGEATLPMMERLCSDPTYPELYVPTFKNNYAQMKMDGPKTHGKVFEDNGVQVWIWDEVEETLLRYKNKFYPGDN